jgi:signal transduction histidine kinase
MPEIPIAGFALEALGAIALALMLSSLDRERRGVGVRHWALGQWALAAGLAASVAVSRATAGSVLQAALRLPAVVLAYWSPALVLLGTWARWNGRLPPRATRQLLAILALLGAATSLASPLLGTAAPLLRSGTRSALTSIAHAGAGALLLRGARRRRLFGARVLAASFFGAALEDALFLVLLVARTAAAPAIARPELLIEFELLLLFLSGVGMVAWLLEDEREAALQLERALRRREALAEMGALVAGVAHEARNPLFGISATLDALQSRLGESAADRHLALMREEIARLSRLMGDLLDYGRPIAAELVPGSLSAAAATAVSVSAAQSEAAGVAVELLRRPGALDVRLDPPRLVQAIQNLVQNAVQHTPRGGRVQVELRSEAQDGIAGFSCVVRDEGPGFAPEDLAHLFEPFYSRRLGGTGLGLSIVQRIVDQHGGRVSADNPPGGGAAVEVWLPAASIPPA